MGPNSTRAGRLAPGILLLALAAGYSAAGALSTRAIPAPKLSFIASGRLETYRAPPVAPARGAARRPSGHTRGCAALNSGGKGSFFERLPSLGRERSALTRLWSNIKSYLARRFHAIRARGSPEPARKPPPDGYVKHTQVNQLSLFDFFDNPRAGAGAPRAKSGLERALPKDSPYLELVSAGPSAVIKSFLRLAPAMVKDAISLTVSTLIGSFYKYSAETTIITTTDRLAALILNLQVTGYIYCNAEQRYRLSALFDSGGPKEAPGGAQPGVLGREPEDQQGALPVGDELLSYVKRLPRSYINGIFDNMNPEILDAMRLSTERTIQLLTENVVNPSYLDFKDQHRLIIQQTGSFAMQLCFWKLALGYCMRDQETIIELSKSLNAHPPARPGA